jgi:D-tagatose-1,6-bisphosphate aldolase subunit GatZ/KbaZ
MAKAEAMVTAYVRAGFSKIHLDTSMGCRGEPIALDDHATAERAVRLAKAAEEAAEAAGSRLPLYVIGTEVPVPGGANHAIDALEPTKASAARRTIEVHRRTFERAGLKSAFERVIAVVVQPGVEFGSENVVHYARGKAGELTELLREEPSLIYEAHSTDYQSRSALSALVQDGFPILKVGPGLTFALREALFGLDLIASELSPDYPPRQLAETMERVMIAESGDWHHHYEGSEIRKRVQRRYSFSDRIRYYWGKPEAGAAVALLLRSLEGVVIPEPLMRQFLPTAPAELEVAGNPTGILVEAIDRVLADYAAACTGNVAEVQECG